MSGSLITLESHMPLIVLQFILMIVALVDVIHMNRRTVIYHVDFHHCSWFFDWINTVLYLWEATI